MPNVINNLVKLKIAALEVKDEEIESREYMKKVEEFVVNIKKSLSIEW